jgi:3-methyl-2-oxobutanoate hydroxymethyltransferase
VHALGGFKVQGKDLDAAHAIVDDATALAEAGCFAVVLECVPDAVARLVTDNIGVPTIGIGAGRHCDGQVLVLHDLLGLEDRVAPKFVRRYAELAADATAAVERFADDVRSGRFPSSEETYHAADTVSEAINLYSGSSEGEDAATERAPA